MAGAVTTTAGNVVLTGELTGDFLVLDARSGDVLYRFNTGGPIGGGVVHMRRQGSSTSPSCREAPRISGPIRTAGRRRFSCSAFPESQQGPCNPVSATAQTAGTPQG
jgi:hypothetical protein